jgi:hypothetical protein
VTTLSGWLRFNKVDPVAISWASTLCPETAWAQCPDAAWMAWFIEKIGYTPKSIITRICDFFESPHTNHSKLSTEQLDCMDRTIRSLRVWVANDRAALSKMNLGDPMERYIRELWAAYSGVACAVRVLQGRGLINTEDMRLCFPWNRIKRLVVRKNIDLVCAEFKPNERNRQQTISIAIKKWEKRHKKRVAFIENPYVEQIAWKWRQ